TYVWSTGATTKSIEVNPTRTTTYTLSATRGGVTNSDTIVVTVENCSTLSEKTKQDEFIVYPNPTNGTIHIKASNNYDILNLNIYTIKGNVVYSGEIQTIDNAFYKTVDLSSLTKGVYIVRLYNSDYHKTKKILLQ
ncbi:MAG: T9SS type A sorting domain-containing protein, partial [Flavobacteriaceae bacterium]|nr:T9SS type A sorting domain-containing protein [Flavobacteriaceae bacterium]